jgi:FtsH-binding integral membrane protein
MEQDDYATTATEDDSTGRSSVNPIVIVFLLMALLVVNFLLYLLYGSAAPKAIFWICLAVETLGVYWIGQRIRSHM